MRIVLDTNVLIAAFIARGVCHQLLEHCISHHDLVTSEFILDEVREKLVAKFKFTSEVAEEVMGLLRSRMEIATPAPLDSPVCRDADDDNILAAAVTGNCRCIITGDKDLHNNSFNPTPRWLPSHDALVLCCLNPSRGRRLDSGLGVTLVC